MIEYKIYFEFYGKKMKTNVMASSVNEAQQIVKNNVNFIKIVPKKKTIDYLKNIFTNLIQQSRDRNSKSYKIFRTFFDYNSW